MSALRGEDSDYLLACGSGNGDPLREVTIDDAAQADRHVSILMGDKVEPRREWIESHVDFTTNDDYVNNLIQE